MTAPPVFTAEPWPALPLDAWRDTYATLHRWLQIVGKVRLAQSAWVNHGWQVALYVTPRGLTTATIPHGTRTFSIDLDFISHKLEIRASDGACGGFALEAQTVADFYVRLMAELTRLGLPVTIHRRPNEIPDATLFDEDRLHAAYDTDCAQRFWRVLVQVDRVFKIFRAEFRGKASPVHVFWGALDIAVSRFSGRVAPPHPGGIPNLPDAIMREAYSHEVCSCGFWPGGGDIDYPAFYSYIYPEPVEFPAARVAPAPAFYSPTLQEFILPYDAVRESTAPDATLLAFLQSTYAAAADAAHWDRTALERGKQGIAPIAATVGGDKLSQSRSGAIG